MPGPAVPAAPACSRARAASLPYAFLERVPRTALGTLTTPLPGARAALHACVDDALFHHVDTNSRPLRERGADMGEGIERSRNARAGPIGENRSAASARSTISIRFLVRELLRMNCERLFLTHASPSSLPVPASAEMTFSLASTRFSGTDLPRKRPEPGRAGTRSLLVNFFDILYEIRSVRDQTRPGARPARPVDTAPCCSRANPARANGSGNPVSSATSPPVPEQRV